MIDPFDLEWGSITPEFINPDKKIVLHVANHNIADIYDLERNVAFLISRVRFLQKHLPPDYKQEVVFDDRGQDIPLHIKEKLKNTMQNSADFKFTTEG